MPFELDLVQNARQWGSEKPWQDLFEKAAARVFSETALKDESLQLSLLLCDDAEITLYNERWRGKAAPTNVLSFPSTPHARAAGFLGDIVLSHDTLAREAKDQQKGLQNHALHLFVHGLLHLLGYDHENSLQAGVMEALEVKILLELGVCDPYEDTA